MKSNTETIPASCERQPFDLEGKAARAVRAVFLSAEGVVPPLQYGLANTPPQFLQVLESTQCDGVPVRVAGGAQEERNLAAEQAERLGPRGDAVPELREPTVQSALVCGSNMGGCM